MIEALSFDFRSHLCCDCIAVQKVHPHVVAVGSYELLPGASPPENDASVSVGVGGQMRAGAIDFFAIGRESLHHVHHLSCAAGELFSQRVCFGGFVNLSHPAQYLMRNGHSPQIQDLQHRRPTAQ